MYPRGKAAWANPMMLAGSQSTHALEKLINSKTRSRRLGQPPRMRVCTSRAMVAINVGAVSISIVTACPVLYLQTTSKTTCERCRETVVLQALRTSQCSRIPLLCTYSEGWRQWEARPQNLQHGAPVKGKPRQIGQRGELFECLPGQIQRDRCRLFDCVLVDAALR